MGISGEDWMVAALCSVLKSRMGCQWGFGAGMVGVQRVKIMMRATFSSLRVCASEDETGATGRGHDETHFQRPAALRRQRGDRCSGWRFEGTHDSQSRGEIDAQGLRQPTRAVR